MLFVIISLLIGFGLAFGLTFLINAATVWIIVTLLKAIGVTMIGTWTVAFSWPLVLLFTIITVVIRGIFSITITTER
jgi:hypothetical protein